MSEVLNINTVISESEIIRRIHKGDYEAVKELYEKYSALLYTLVKRIIKDETQAEKILTDIFISIKERINYFDPNSKNIYAWLIILTRNYAVFELRKGEEKFKNITKETREKYIIPDLSHVSDPLELEKAFELKDRIQEAFNKLDNTRQHLITLAFYEGFTQREIAEKLKIPFTTVESEIKTSVISLNEKFKAKPALFTVENELIETIYPYVIGCLDFEEQGKTSDRFKDSEPFPWKLLGEYQNLVALLPTMLDSEYPTEKAEKRISDQMNSVKKVQSFERVSSLDSEGKKDIPDIKNNAGVNNTEKGTGKNISAKTAGKIPTGLEPVIPLQQEKEKRIVQDREKSRKSNFVLILLIVLIVLFITSGVLAYLYYRDRVLYYETQIADLTNRVETITNEIRSRPEIPGLGELKNQQTIELTNMSETFSSGEIIFSYEDKRGYLHVRSLPVLDPDNAYQLWGNFDGNFISLGVFKISSRSDYYPFTLPEFVNEAPVEFYVIESNAEGSRRPGSKIYLQGRTE